MIRAVLLTGALGASMTSIPAVSLTFPEELSIVEDSKFDVDADIEVDEADAAEFQAKFRRQFMCFSLDSAPYICYPVFGLTTKPRFVGLEDGVHTLEARLTDPVTGRLRENSSSGIRVFSTMSPKPLEKFKPQSPATGDEPSPSDAETRVNIDMPRLAIKSPQEAAAVPFVFNSVVTVQTATPESFNRHFKSQYACLRLDSAAHHACFPVFGLRVMPRYVEVEEGPHTLEARLTHPDNGDVIAGSSSGVRSFVSQPQPRRRASAAGGGGGSGGGGGGGEEEVVDLDDPADDAEDDEEAMAAVPQAAMTPAGLREEFHSLDIPKKKVLPSGASIVIDVEHMRFFSEVSSSDSLNGLGVEGTLKSGGAVGAAAANGTVATDVPKAEAATGNPAV
jgi:hypothetical protein